MLWPALRCVVLSLFYRRIVFVRLVRDEVLQICLLNGRELFSLYLRVVFVQVLAFYLFWSGPAREGVQAWARVASRAKVGLHFVRLRTVPIRVRRGPSANGRSLRASYNPNVQGDQGRVCDSIVTLRRRFDRANDVTGITIGLREQVDVGRVEVDPSLQVDLFRFVSERRLRRVVGGPRHVVAIRRANPRVGFPTGKPANDFITALWRHIFDYLRGREVNMEECLVAERRSVCVEGVTVLIVQVVRIFRPFL